MAKSERRKGMPLDEAYFYCRRLELKLERPALFKVCNAIRTIDLALSPEAEEDTSSKSHVSLEAWSQVRDQLFKILITSFPGYFLAYRQGSSEPIEYGDDWPENSYIEFYPEKILRRFETYTSECSRIDAQTLSTLRWCFSQDRQNISPSIFDGERDELADANEAIAFLDRMYEICEEEASEGKKKAHRKWCQLYWEANSCRDKSVRHELQKQMANLQSVWGRPAQLV